MIHVDRHTPAPEGYGTAAPAEEGGQLMLFPTGEAAALPAVAPTLPPLAAIPESSAYRVKRLSYSALALFEHCSYRFYAERLAGLSPSDRRAGDGAEGDEGGLAATEVGDAVHAALEQLDLRRPAVPAELDELVRKRYPEATPDELGRVRSFVESYCESELARRVAALPAAASEVPFAFEHDGVLLHGRIDVLSLSGGRAVVVDYKTNSLAEGAPDELVENDYRLQRLVYALACFRTGAEEVEVVYHFLERADAVVSATFARDDVRTLEVELSEAIGRIQAGRFAPTPSEFNSAGCPVLDVVCAGPRLRSGRARPEAAVAVPA
jgi:hypothetical protein